VSNAKQSIHSPPRAEPDAAAMDTEGDDHERYESLRHPPRSEPTPSYDEFRDERAASGGGQMGRTRGVKANGARNAEAHPQDKPREQPLPGADPELHAQTHQGADYRRYRGTPQGFRAEPGPAAMMGEPMPKRSDASVEQDVRDFLLRDGLLDLEVLEVRVHEGHVEIHGRARTGRGSYRAAELATHVAGVRDVKNCLEVSEPDDPV
jgi:hypothetical protein